MMDLIINLNKPKGITSHSATLQVKKILKAKRAGHAGTLDPIATGVLLVCINRATRLTSYFSFLDKEYRVIMKLGEVTDTQDSGGTVLKKADRLELDKFAIEEALKSFEGEILQKPPMFSALKYRGKPLYKYARKGLDIPRKQRVVYIYLLEILDISLPFVHFKARCSKGTYIRTLCNDIGVKLGVGAHLYGLERVGIGSFGIGDSLDIDELSSIDTESSQRGVYTMDSALSWMPEFSVTRQQVRSVKNGMPVKMGEWHNFTYDMKAATGIRIKSPDGELLAIGSLYADRNLIKMDVVFGTQ